MPDPTPAVLMLTTVLPERPRSGGEIVSRAIVDALDGAGFGPRVIGYRRRGETATPDRRYVSAGERPIETRAAGLRVPVWMGRALASRSPYSVAKYRSRSYAAAVGRLMEGEPRAVLVDHAQVSFAVPDARRIPLVYIAHNVESGVYAELRNSARSAVSRWTYGREARAMADVERKVLSRAAQVWAFTEDDAAALQLLDPPCHVRVLDVASAVDPPARFEPSSDIALIGNWTWEPNGRGLAWFVSEVVPRLPASASVAIAGLGARDLEGKDSRLSVVGPVADASRFLASARVVAVPGVAGGGVQVKTLDAIASGAAVVTTPTAARGLAELPSSVTVAANPDEFAAALANRLAAPLDPRDRDEAIAWTANRRRRFAEAVAGHMRELLPAVEPPGA